MTKSIALFNHKGGVSKTTTTFNLGWGLAEHGNKVLVVDLDPQCNLTGLILEQEAIDDKEMERFYSSRDNLTMKPIVEAAIKGTKADMFVEGESGKIVSTGNPNLYLLPGHLSLADLDSQISISLKIAFGVPATQDVPGALPKIIQLLAQTQEIDYVLYDLSPSVGGLNEVVLMSSDYFIVPASPDYFCLQAIGSLEKTVLKWHDEINRFIEGNNFPISNFPIKNHPKFLGAIQQRYRPRHEKPAKSFQLWIDRIRETINERFVPSLKSIDCLVNEEKMNDVLTGTGLQPYDLAHVSDFNSLIAISQQVSKPVFSMTDEDIAVVGKVFGHAKKTMIDNRDSFKTIFESLSERVERLTA